jgi:carbon-monoxide dehydrogenase small subunit
VKIEFDRYAYRLRARVCGACTIVFNGEAVRSRLMLVVQADEAEVMTVEGLASPEGKLHPLQKAFWDHHALQCGFCTPGMLMATLDRLRTNRPPTEEEIRTGVAAVICRCTGYQGIVEAVQDAAKRMRSSGEGRSNKRARSLSALVGEELGSHESNGQRVNAIHLRP